MKTAIGRGEPKPQLATLFFSAGFLALVVQVYLLRELVVSLQGDEAAIGLGLAAWFAGITGGALAGRRFCRNRPEVLVTAGLCLLAIAGPGEAILARTARLLLGMSAGEVLPVGSSLAIAAVVLCLPGAFVGLMFTSLAALAPRAGWKEAAAIARLYVAEALGSLAAGISVTFVLIPHFPPLHALALVCAACVLAGVPAARGGWIRGRILLPILALVLAVAALPPASSVLEQATERARFRCLAPGIPLLAWTDTPYEHVMIGGGRTRHLYLGGQYAGSFPDPEEQEVLAHSLATLSLDPTNVLAVGGLPQGALRFLLLHPVSRVDLIEMDAKAFGLVRAYLPRRDRKALEDPRVRIVTDDPRRFLARSRDRYGLILIEEPDPVTLLLARLTTAEFFRLAAEHLAPGGVLVTRLATAPNVLAGERAALGASVFRAVREAFPFVRATPGPESFLVAGFSSESTTLDPKVLSERFRSRNVQSRAFVPEMFDQLYPPERVASQEAALTGAAPEVPASRDARPVSFLHALALRQTIAGSSLAPLLSRASRSSPPALALIFTIPSLAVLCGVLLMFLARRPAIATASLHAVAATGACGMSWSLAILFLYQTRVGVLYGQLGWLTALFMLGLAIGGSVAGRAAIGAPGRAKLRLTGAALLTLLFAVLVPIALRAVTRLPAGSSAAAAAMLGGLLLVCGVFTGIPFPLAAAVLLQGGAQTGSAGGAVEAADHAGAMAAALLGAVIFIPALGLPGTGWLCVAIQVVAVAGMIVAIAASRRIPAGRGNAG